MFNVPQENDVDFSLRGSHEKISKQSKDEAAYLNLTRLSL